MITFWIAAALLSITAVVLVLLPWIKRDRVNQIAAKFDQDERNRVNVRIFKERMREITADKTADLITQEEYEALKKELEDSLVADAVEIENAGANTQDSSIATPLTLGVLALMTVLVGVLLYERWGVYDLALNHHNSRFTPNELAQARANAEAGDTRALLVQLRDKLRNSPENVQGWSLLARSAMNSEHFDIAVEAYDTLIATDMEDAATAALLGLKAQALYFSGSAFDSPMVQEAIQSAYELDPFENNSLGIEAIAAFESGEYRAAITAWEKILESNPNHPSRQSIEMGIMTARNALGDDVNEIEAITNQPPAEGSILVQLSIAPDVISALGPEQILVVFARASEGPPMPLAVVREETILSAMSFVLDDSMAMMPDLTLSSFGLVDIIARITTGSVQSAPGDFEVLAQNVTASEYSNRPLQLVITRDDVVQ